MIVYLDQNKWIELARMFHGKETSPKAAGVLREFESAANGGVKFPLSSFHYIETSRISNVERTIRLGTAMWHFSRGVTIASYEVIVRHELENALAEQLPQVRVGSIEILGRGHTHAFGVPPLRGVLQTFENEVERSILMGNERLSIAPPAFHGTTQRDNFQQYLSTLNARYNDLPKDLRENWLYAMSTIDILNPINDVLARQGAKHNTSGEVKRRASEAGSRQHAHSAGRPASSSAGAAQRAVRCSRVGSRGLGQSRRREFLLRRRRLREAHGRHVGPRRFCDACAYRDVS